MIVETCMLKRHIQENDSLRFSTFLSWAYKLSIYYYE